MAKHVIIRSYTQFWDHKNNVEFTPVLDVAKGLRIGHAYTDVDFSGRPAFETLSDADYARLISGANVEAVPDGVAESLTGDPLEDALRGNVKAPKGAASSDPLAQ